MTQDNGEHEDHRELLKRFDENTRPWQTYWFWRDRPLAEREAALTVSSERGSGWSLCARVRSVRTRLTAKHS